MKKEYIDDLIGNKFGMLTIIKRIDKKYKDNKNKIYYLCQCDCGNVKEIYRGSIINGYTKSCGCQAIKERKNRIKDLTGQKFGRLTIIKRVEKPKNKKTEGVYWLCKCDCGNEVIIFGSSLKNGRTKSCGCLVSDSVKEKSKKYNIYNLTGEYGIGYTSKGEEFYFDLDDYDKIKDICWYKNSSGYLINVNRHNNPATIWLHRVIMNPEEHEMVDHINHNPSDNRKKNLRKCIANENVRYQTISSRNTSGVIGVYQDKESGNWFARVTVNYEVINLGYYTSKKDAIRARLLGEQKYYKEFAPQKHLFKKYEIDN